jgi:NADH-quinone oxidoreductase subunit L
MLTPVVILALGAIAGGFVPFGKFVTADGRPLESGFHLQFSIAPVLVALAGILAATRLYKKQNTRADSVAASLGRLYRAAYHKFYIDEFYVFVTKKFFFNILGRLPHGLTGTL